MKSTRLLVAVCALSLGVAFAASNKTVKVIDPIWVGQTELKPGDYKVQVDGDKATIMLGKDVMVTGKVENGSTKFSHTEFGTKSVNGKTQLDEIDLGGTNSKITFGGATAPVPAGS